MPIKDWIDATLDMVHNICLRISTAIWTYRWGNRAAERREANSAS